MKKQKKYLAWIMVFSLIVQLLPVKAAAIEGPTQPKDWYEYALLAASNQPLEINSSEAAVNGDMHTNGDFIYRGSRLSALGTVEASGIISAKNSKSTIGKRVENAPAITVPDMMPALVEMLDKDSPIIDGTKNFSGKYINIDKSMLVKGDLNFDGSQFNGKGYILAENNINFTVSRINQDISEDVVIASNSGNITINAANVNINGVIYAPKGTVTINTSSFTLKGSIIAKKIIYKGSKLNVSYKEGIDELMNIYPPLPKLTAVSEGSAFLLNWNRARSCTKYSVMRKFQDGEYAEITSGIKLTSYSDNSAVEEGIYTYKIVASNSKGYEVSSNEAIVYVSRMGNGIYNNDRTDTDLDGLYDYEETNKFHTDFKNPDTDSDGIKDGDEVLKLYTNPLKMDTDDDGITDDKEDIDNDGLNNLAEINLGSNPKQADSDFDNLNDLQETIYKTDFNKEDTDEDGITDGNEIVLGTNPLLADSDNNGVLDGDERFSTTVSVKESEKDPKVEPSITMDLSGKNMGTVSISNVGEINPYLSSDIPGYIGAPYEFKASAAFESAQMKFSFDKVLLGTPGFDPAIYYFNEETKLLELLPNQSINAAEGSISVNVTHFSTYILLNKKTVDEVWSKEMKAPHSGELENVELVIGFSIDSSGSMSWNDPYDVRKQTAKEFVDKMDSNDQAAVVDFDSYGRLNCPLTSDKTVIKSAIDRIDSSGGTSLTAGMRTAINAIKANTSKVKYIIMLTDGEGDYDHTLTQQAKSLGIVVYTIGLGNSVDEYLLKRIAEETGGKYYHADSSDELNGIFDDASEETIDLTKDSDNDGLSDYHEKRGVRVNTTWLYTSYLDSDSDDDGLLDGEELEYVDPIYGPSYFKMITNPNKKDSDGDTIKDNIDLEPMLYNITDRTLSLAAALSYSNLKNKQNYLISSLISSGFSFDGIDSDCAKDIKDWKVIYANESGAGVIDMFSDNGLGSVAIKLSRMGKPDTIIFAYRGTEPNDDKLNDFYTDAVGGLSRYTPQSDDAFDEYKALVKKYPNAEFYLAGHSLGGRIVQDVLYKTYNNNESIFRKDIKTPQHSATFNALGYDRLDYWALENDILRDIKGKLTNYYYKNDLVGEGLGASALYSRIGTNVGPWTARDRSGNIIVADDKFGYAFSKVHGIDLWNYDKNLNYPTINILD